MYLPRGVMHEATTSDTESLHITLGVLHNNWTELLVESLARLSLRDPELRKALPCGYARDDFDRSAARETFHRLLAEAVGRVDFDEAFDHFVEDVISTRHPVHNEQRHAVRAAATPEPDTPVVLRPHLLWRLRRVARADSICRRCARH